MPSSFGGNTLSGTNNNLFNPPNNNNLFSNNNSNAAMGSANTMWNNSQSSANNNLFSRSTPMPTSLFTGTSGGSTNAFTNTGNPFQSNTSMMTGQTNTGIGSFNNPLNSSSSMTNNLFNTSNRHNYNTRGNMTVGSTLSSMSSHRGTMGSKFTASKNGDSFLIQSVNYMPEFKDRSLDELRMEDYALIKSGDVPDHLKKQISANLDTLNRNTGSNNIMMGQSSSTSNNLFGQSGNRTPGLSLNNNPMGGSTMGAPAFGNNNNNNSLNRNSPWPSTGGTTIGGGASNNLFQPTSFVSNNNNNSTLPAFGGSQQTPNNGFQSNNLFAQSGNNQSMNLFGQNQNQNQNQSSNIFGQQHNMGSGFPQMQPQNSMFPQSNSNAQTGVNLFQNNAMSQSNAFAQNKNAPSLFPNPNMNSSNSFLPKMNPAPGFPTQAFPQSAPNFFNNNGMNSQQQTQQNPHLFPPFQNNLGGGGAAPFFNSQSFGQSTNQFNQQQQFPGFAGPMQQQNPMMFNNNMGQPNFQGYYPQQNPQNDYFNNNSHMQPYSQNPGFNYERMQTSHYVPYQEDRSQPSYMSRTTLNDIVTSLDSKLNEDQKSSSPQRILSRFPYNPFERKSTRRADIENREPVRNPSALWPSVSQSILRKPDDAFSLIKKSRYMEDDVEIIMRPKITLPSMRNRSYSPVSNRSRDRSRERDLSVEDHRKPAGKNIYNNTFKLKVATRSSVGRKDVDVQIFKKAMVFDLKIKILEILRNSNLLKLDVVSVEELADKSVLFFNDRRLADDQNLDQIGLSDDSSLTLHVGGESPVEENIPRQRRLSEEIRMETYATVRGEDSITASKFVPKLTMAGYTTSPTIEELSRMSDRDLAMVENFTVMNQFGKIEFEGRTDVRGVNLDDVIVIYNRNVEVYPDEKFPTDTSKPIRGEKLNKPALITLYNCTFPWKHKGAELKKRLENHTKKMDCEFIDYDEANGIFRLRATHF